jgi:hypothetical protein
MINFAYIGCMSSSIDKSVSIFDNVRTGRHSNIQFLIITFPSCLFSKDLTAVSTNS